LSVLDAGSYQISLFCSFKELDFAIMQNPQLQKSDKMCFVIKDYLEEIKLLQQKRK